MKFLITILLIFILSNCSKPKTVLICGDHVCINKTEAEQYFEENLSIEIKVINKKIKKETNLIELNLNNTKNKREVNLVSKKDTSKNLKTLSKKEINEIKENLKIKQKNKTNNQVAIKNKKKIKDKTKSKTWNKIENNKKNINISKKNVNKKSKDVLDVCTILEKCSIDEISKYLLKQGNKKDFPDITSR